MRREGRNTHCLLSLHLACCTFLRFAILLRSKVQGPPSLAHPFTGAKVHWTFVCIRFTLFRCANPGFAFPSRPWLRSNRRRLAPPLRSAPSLRNPGFARVPAQTIRDLGVRRSYSAAHPAPLGYRPRPSLVWASRSYPATRPCFARRLRRAGLFLPFLCSSQN